MGVLARAPETVVAESSAVPTTLWADRFGQRTQWMTSSIIR
jgi:hypothetical protein